MKGRDTEQDIWSWEWLMLALSGLFALLMALVLLFVFWQYQMNKGRFSLPSFSSQEETIADEEKYRILAELHSTSTEEISLEERIAALQALSEPSEEPEMSGEEGEAQTQAETGPEVSPEADSSAPADTQANTDNGGERGNQTDAESGSASSLSHEEKMQILESL